MGSENLLRRLSDQFVLAIVETQSNIHQIEPRAAREMGPRGRAGVHVSRRRQRAFPRALSSFRVWLLLGCPLGLAGHTQISARWNSKMNLFTIIGIIVVVLFVAGYFGLH
jgi:hypothetical protein